MAKAKKQTIAVDGMKVTVKYPTIKKEIVLDVALLPDDVRTDAMLHGICQKLGDAASGGTPAEKYDMASRIVESLLSGNWNLTSKADDSGTVIEAVARVKEAEIADIEAAIERAGEDGPALIRKWKTNPKVIAAIAAIKAERAAAAAVDSDDLDLEGFDEETDGE